MKKRRHHFVWQYYLAPWTVNGQISCLRKDKIFRTGTTAIAVETDFYRLKELTSHDIKMIRMLIIEKSPTDLRQLHEGWITTFTAVLHLREAYALSGLSDPEVERELDDAMSNTEEDLHASIEVSSAHILKSIRHMNVDFFSTEEGFSDFIYYLAVQYMRTKKIKTAAMAAVNGLLPGFSLERAWNLMSHMYATNIGAAFVRRRQNFRLTLLSTASDNEFITSDQPVINTRASEASPGEPPEKLEFYYPVSPTVAVLVGDELEGPRPTALILDPPDVVRYNRLMADSAHEQIFSTSTEVLRRILNETKE